MRVYCATTNPGKLREFELALQGEVDIAAVPNLSSIAPPEETGATFEENAVLKALYYAKFCDGLVFADDSGLEVDGLGGAPGVYSARYAGAAATDQDNNNLVLEKLKSVIERSARFVCVIALAQGPDVLQIVRGTVEGNILDAPRGKTGFGYDPLFFYPPFACSFGEAPLDAKMRVSHRGQALAALLAYLKGLP